MTQPSRTLEEIAAKIRPVLKPLGFRYSPGSSGTSSGGRFATGFFVRPPMRLALIVRDGELGLPNYEWGDTNCGHDGLVAQLGRSAEARLLWDREKWRLRARGWMIDVVEALVLDLKNIVVPAMEKPEQFRDAVVEAHAEWTRRLQNAGRRSPSGAG
jgi:hypothetical protein